MSNCSIKGEDEEELESLRLAALESLRAKGLPPPALISIPTKPLIPTNQIFQRHFGNQNLIAIIPVDQSTVKVDSSKLTDSNSTHNQPKVVPNSVKTPAISLCQLKNSAVSADKIAEVEKPKVSTKFSRFEDSDSDESDEIEVSFSKSDSEAEENVTEKEEPVIEEEEDEEEEEFIILEESPEDLTEGFLEEAETVRIPSPKKEEAAIKKSDSLSNRNYTSESKRTAKSPVRSFHRKTSEPDTGRRKTTESNSRSRSDKTSKSSKSSGRSSPYHRTSEKRREPERQKKSEKPVSPQDRSRKPVLSDSERDRLESRKRKFERAVDPLRIEGKIRLKIGETKEDVRPSKDPVILQVVDDVAQKKLKKSKKSKDSSKEKRIKNGGSRSVCEADDGKDSVIISKNCDQSLDSQSDLRAELQRRRFHRFEEDESRSKTPDKVESRRILVLNDPSPLPPPVSSAPAPSSEPSSSSDSSVLKRSSVHKKRSLLASATVEGDQGITLKTF